MTARRLAWDQGFVAAAPARVDQAVADAAGYAAWWPGAAVTAREEGFTVRLPGVPPLVVQRQDRRPQIGVVFRVDGRVRGRWEWYLEPFEEGTIVNALFDLEIPGGERSSARGLYRLRATVRRGLVALKGALE